MPLWTTTSPSLSCAGRRVGSCRGGDVGVHASACSNVAELSVRAVTNRLMSIPRDSAAVAHEAACRLNSNDSPRCIHQLDDLRGELIDGVFGGGGEGLAGFGSEGDL